MYISLLNNNYLNLHKLNEVKNCSTLRPTKTHTNLYGAYVFILLSVETEYQSLNYL